MAFLRRSCITATPHRVPCRILDTRSNSAADRGHVAIGNPPSPKVPPIRNYAPLSREEPCSPRLAKLCGLFSSLCIGGGLFDSEKFFLFLFFLGEVKRLREFLLGIRRRDSKRMVERLFLAFEYGCRGSASFSKGM